MESRRRPSRSGFNTARKPTLQVNEVAKRHCDHMGRHTEWKFFCNKGGTAYITSLAIEILQGTF